MPWQGSADDWRTLQQPHARALVRALSEQAPRLLQMRALQRRRPLAPGRLRGDAVPMVGQIHQAPWLQQHRAVRRPRFPALERLLRGAARALQAQGPAPWLPRSPVLQQPKTLAVGQPLSGPSYELPLKDPAAWLAQSRALQQPLALVHALGQPHNSALQLLRRSTQKDLGCAPRLLGLAPWLLQPQRPHAP